MPDTWGNPTLEDQIQTTLLPYMQGGPGSSPMLDAATAAFQQAQLPMLQEQMTLTGMGESPLAVQVYGNVLAQNLVPLIQADMANQLAATGQAQQLGAQQFQQQIQPELLAVQQGELGVHQGELGLAQQMQPAQLALQEQLGMGQLGLSQQQLNQQAAAQAAAIANDEALRQMQAYGTAGNMYLGLTNPYSQAMQGQIGQQQTALTGYSQAGTTQQMTAQQVEDAMRMELLRLQGLGEATSTGVFGGSTVPPSIAETSSTTGSTSK
jgi:plasmid maintenance system antidote protein VapI